MRIMELCEAKAKLYLTPMQPDHLFHHNMTQGTLYIVATPIGNLEDITLRALQILKKADIVYCEDTRQTRKLLSHYEITTPTRSLHSHSHMSVIDSAIQEMHSGKSIAYVSDSGTPCLSDPGSRLVSEARVHGITVSPIPGPSALAALASVTGFPATEIIFAGFLSKKEGRRQRELQTLKGFHGTIILYESPYRIRKLLNSIAAVFPHKRVLIAREMTKYYEEFISADIEDIVQRLESIKEKGEFALAIYNSTDVKKAGSPDEPDD